MIFSGKWRYQDLAVFDPTHCFYELAFDTEAEAREKFEAKREHAKVCGGRGVLWGPDGRRVDGFSHCAENE